MVALAKNQTRRCYFGGRLSLLEDDLRWKTTFGGRQPSVEDDLRWKTTFRGRQLLVEGACCLVHFAAFFLNHHLSLIHLLTIVNNSLHLLAFVNIC